MPSNHLILCPPLLLPSCFPIIRVFSSELVFLIRWPKYWSFSFSISPSNECSGLTSFRMDWFDLAVPGTLKSLLQHHSLRASILWCSTFFMVQLSHPYMTTGKTIALTRRTFAGKVKSLIFNMLSSLVIAFLPRSKCLSISAVIICSDFWVQENKVSHCFHCLPRSRCFSGTLVLSLWPSSVGNLISGSSAFSKSSLNIWKFSVHILWSLACHYRKRKSWKQSLNWTGDVGIERYGVFSLPMVPMGPCS